MERQLLVEYADLVVRSGVNLQPGQALQIGAPIGQVDFVRLLTESAYRNGAKKVRVDWTDQPLSKLHYQYQTMETICQIEDWEEERMKHDSQELQPMIRILSEDPDGLDGVDPEKMRQSSIARYNRFSVYRDAMENKYQWTICAAAGKEWAQKVFPDATPEQAVEMLWKKILDCVYVTGKGDAVEAWERHDADFDARCKWLNERKFDHLVYKDVNGTDFTVWLSDRICWQGGEERLASGLKFNPNMPTEEIYTTPISGRAQGTVVSSKPLSFEGKIIEDFSFTFTDGKVTQCRARKGEEALKTIISRDEGASRIGEISLVPYDSPISQSGLLYYETLFDENASCHIALGRGFSNLLEGYENGTKEDWKKAGINDSMIHMDFMVGTPTLDITGVRRDGTEIPVFRKGKWAF